MLHRGPDRQGVFASRLISLGVARLKIIDLDSGDQPMAANNGDAVIAFNGEIYNHAELRNELERRGHHFETRSDTETVLRGFIEWGVGCFPRLRGMFAVALWTESERRLILARDRMGIKPLYIARRGEDLYFGSELKTIFLHPEIDRKLDLASLDCYLSLNYVPCPATMVEGIEKLPPGYWLEWRDGQVRSEPYWRAPRDPATAWDPREARERLDSLLSDSVREHLLSDVPVGLWLSGGLDSPTILHYAAAACTAPVNTFSISFHGRSFDESAYIRRLASHYGARHEELDLNPGLDLAGATEEFAQYADEPNGDSGALPVWFLSKMTRRKATVALSGEGADELFGGYVTYRANMLARLMRRFPDWAIGWGSAMLRAWPVSDEKVSLEYKLKRFLDGVRMTPERAHVYWNGTFSDAEKRRLVRIRLPNALEEKLACLAGAGDRLESYLRFDQGHYLPDDILAKVDRMSMAHSVEVRPPFLDHRIVEFAASLPASLKIAGGRQKVLLRDLMKDRLPSPALRRKKVGFDIPAHEWLRGPLRPLLLDTLAAGAAAHGGLFNGGEIQSCVDAHLARRANYGYHLWGLMILFLWMRKWQIRTEEVPVVDRSMVMSAIPS